MQMAFNYARVILSTYETIELKEVKGHMQKWYCAAWKERAENKRKENKRKQ